MRKLASIQKVVNTYPIQNADFIEGCTILGWNCIVKKEEVKKDMLVVYFEIDSFLPDIPTYKFLTPKKKYNNKMGYRLKTIKLKKTLSQGLALPFTSFPKEIQEQLSNMDEGDDVSELLGVLKWEHQEATQTRMQSGQPKGKFPSFVPKTDQPRLQGLPHYFELHKDTLFEETLKLDGSSITMFKVQEDLPWYKRLFNQIVPGYFDGVKFGVCSRNLELKPADNFSKEFKNGDKLSEYNQSDFWKTALKYDMHKKVPVGYAVQAELIGPRIQSNHEKVNDLELHIYDIYNIAEQRYLNPIERAYIMSGQLQGVPHVPVLNKALKIFNECTDFDSFQERVTGESINPGTVSEGRCYKAMDGSFSFKLISNKYLLRYE